jgi:AcrR family transcriptional regulator
VNYHFGDKAGLYRAVVTFAIEVMRETNELSQRAGEGLSPEDQIRGFVRVFVSRLTGDGPKPGSTA